MLTFTPRLNRFLLMVLLVAASLGLMAFGRAPQMQPALNALALPLTWLQETLALGEQGIEAVVRPQETTEDLRQRLAVLEAENAQLRAEILLLREQAAQLNILTELLQYRRQTPNRQYLTANVIGRDPSPLLQYFILDRGSDDGIRRDMPVVTASGLVGRVVQVTNSASRVLPITDPTSAVNARLQDTRDEGTVVGQPGGGLSLNYISQQAKIASGQTVITSGLGGIYPPGIIIGTVNAIQRLDYEVLQRADLLSAVNFGNLEIVLIITNYQPENTAPLLQSP